MLNSVAALELFVDFCYLSNMTGTHRKKTVSIGFPPKNLLSCLCSGNPLA